MADESDVDVIGKIVVDDSDATGRIQSFGDSTNQLADNFNHLGLVGDFVWGNVIVKGIGMAIDGLKGGIDAVVGFAQSVIDEGAEEQDTMAQLNNEIVNMGANAPMTSDAMVQMADSISRVTIFGKNAALQAEDVLARFTSIGKDAFPLVMKAGEELAAGTGRDLVSTMQLLGRSLDDPVAGMGTLRRLNIVLTEAQKESIKTFTAQGDALGAQKVMLDAINASYGGSAAAAASTYHGQLQILANTFDSIKDKLGEAIMPALTNLENLFTTLANDPRVTGMFTDLANTISAVATPIATLISDFANWKDSGLYMSFDLRKIFGPDVGSQIFNIVNAVKGFIDIFLDSKNGGLDFVSSLSSAFSSLDNISPIFGKIGDAIMAIFGGSLTDKIKGGLGQITSLFQPIITAFEGLFGAFQKSGPQMGEAAQKIGASFMAAFGTALPVVIKNVTQAIQGLTEFWKNNGTQIIQIVTFIVQVLIGAVSGAIVLITGIFKTFVDWLNIAVKGWRDIFSGNWAGAWNDTKALTSTILADIGRIITSTLDTVLHAFGSNLKQFDSIWSGTFQAIWLTARLIWGQIAAFFTDQWDEWIDNWKKILLLWTTIFSDVGGKLYSIGKDIIGGLLRGLQEAWVAVTQWIQDAAQKIEDLFRLVTGSHSPSSVFADIGKDLMAGLGQGIMASISIPVNAMAGVIPQSNNVGSFAPSSTSRTPTTVQIFVQGSGDPRAVANEVVKILKLNGVQVL